MPLEDQKGASAAAERSPLVLSAGVGLVLAACAGLLCYGAGRGIDLTDEIFYLIWSRDPEAYALLYQPFGYLLHPLYVLVGGDVARFRLAGFAITLLAGAALGFALAPAGRVRLFAAYGAAAALTIYFPWIITPSYNSAANAGMMLAIAGLLLTCSAPSARAGAGIVAIALGLCAMLYAKPPAFLLVALAVAGLALWSWRHDRERGLRLLLGLVLAVPLIGLFFPLLRFPALVARILASQQTLALPNAIGGLLPKILRDWTAVPPELIAALLLGIAGLALFRWRRAPWLGAAAMLLALGHCAWVGRDAIEGGLPEFVGLALIALALGYAVVLGPGRRPPLVLLLPLLAAPPAVALGTFNNQWSQLNFSMVFPFVALFLLAAGDPRGWRRGAMQALCAIGPVALLLFAACFPYSLPASIFAQTIPVRHPITGSMVLVDEETADFVTGGHDAAKGAVLIDLSGTGPGVAAVVGARAPVLPWLNPATPRWPDAVWAELPAEARARAWFVAPVWPLFVETKPARWLVAHRAGYCRTPLPPMTFWEEERQLELWRPCAGQSTQSSPISR